MSWAIQVGGTKSALHGEIAKVMDTMIQNSPTEPYRSEYAGAKAALDALVDSMPADGFYLLKGNGSTSCWSEVDGKRHVHGAATISIESYTSVT